MRHGIDGEGRILNLQGRQSQVRDQLHCRFLRRRFTSGRAPL
jgi:hypothetical protein